MPDPYSDVGARQASPSHGLIGFNTMRTKLFVIAIALAATLAGQSKTCDRACLEPFVDKYLDAMVAHDPAKAPFAKGVKFTENGQRLELGDGLWNTMTGKGTFRLFVTDVEAQQVAFLGTITEANVGAVIGLRLRIRNNQITEAEHFIQRSPSSAAGFERIGYKWTDVVPPAERMPRDELVKTANMYFSGMQKNDGKGDYPFAHDCNRIENGGFSTNSRSRRASRGPIPRRPRAIPATGAAWSSSRADCCTSSRAFAIGGMWPSIRNADWCSLSASSIIPPATRATSKRPTAAR